MDDSETSKVYRETQSSIKKLLARGVSIDKTLYTNQLVLIKNDITFKDESARKPALDMLDFLLSLNVEEIQTEIIKILQDATVNKLIQNLVLKSIKKKIMCAILEDKFNVKEIITPWKNQNINKLTNIIEEVCLNDLPKDKCKNVFINNIIPTMMSITTDNDTRGTLTDIAFMLSTIVPISDLTLEELNAFLHEINTKYVKAIGELRDQDYANWHNLWIFLIRFCDKNIHNSMDLTNRLLRVVEYAFRNSSVQQRLKGYECWKELIDNASLDMTHMCSSKQIKLLITPLKAKFSKQEVVIRKRFDVFTYLLEKLQHKAVLCLTEFLEFCFGPVGDTKDISKTGQGRSIPEIWIKSTQVLVEIIGHSHGKSVSCLSSENVIKLEKPVINYANISTYYKVIINAVGECCALLKDIDIESKRDTVIKCMWKSIFNLVVPTPDLNRTRYFEVISKVLTDYIELCRENPYFEELLILIFTVLMSYDEEFVYEVIQYILKQLMIIIFTVDNFPITVADKFKLVVSHAFSKIVMVENKLRVIKDLMVAFTQLKPNEENIMHISKIWLCLADELISDLKAKQIEEFAEFNDFFMWPAYHLHHLEESTRKQIVLYWMKLYRKISIDSEIKKQSVLKDLEKIFKNNPLLSSGVVSLLNVMSQFETKFSKEFVIKLMEVSSLILVLPNLKTDDEQKITALVMQYFEPSLLCYNCEGYDEVIRNICECIKHILCIHKGYKLLDTLSNFIKNSPVTLKTKFSHYLSGFFLDLFNKETDTKSFNAKELQKALQVFKIENDSKQVTCSFIPPGGRSARIAKLVKNSPRSPQSKLNPPESTALRLFGKDLETLSPLNVKGSQLNNTTPGKSKKSVTTVKRNMISSPSINDEKAIDFVPIDTEVKFQPEKLSRHQIEVLKKRREDIPALYQDLSQSLSQDMFNSNSSSSKGFEKNSKENSADSRKVIVEVIGLPFKAINKENDKVDEPSLVTSEVIPEAPLQTIKDAKVLEKVIEPEGDKFSDACLESEAIGEKSEAIGEDYSVEGKKENNEIAESEHVREEASLMVESAKSENEETSRPQSITREGKDAKVIDAKERKRKQRVELELQKLKMDIVGADTFLSASSRRTRIREKTKQFEETVKKTKSSSKEETSPPQESHNSRKSFNLEKSTTKVEKNRRKSIAVVQDIRSEGRKEDNTNNVTIEGDKSISLLELPKIQYETPKSSRKKSLKAKIEDKTLVLKTTNPKQSEPSRSVNQEKKLPTKLDHEKVVVNENNGDKIGQKRKYSSCDLDSEDIIESSQESPADVTIFNFSKRRNISGIGVEEKLNKTEGKSIVGIEEKLDVPKENIIDEVQKEPSTNEGFTPTVEGKLEKMKKNAVAYSEEEIKDNAMEETEVGERIEELPLNIEEVAAEVELPAVDAENVGINQIEEKLDDTEELLEDLSMTPDTTLTHTPTEDLSHDLSQDRPCIVDNTPVPIANHNQDVEMQDTQTQKTEMQETETQDRQTQDTPTQTEFFAMSEDNRPPVLYFDLPKKPNLTESEKMMCQMDTMSICSDPNNVTLKAQMGDSQSINDLEIKPESSQDESKEEKLIMEDALATSLSQGSSSIPSSPVTVETPIRTTELLNNTLDISPIFSKSSSFDDEETPEGTSVSVSLNFNAEMEELNRIEKEVIPETELEKIDEQCGNENKDNEKGVKIVEKFDQSDNLPNVFDDLLRPNKRASGQGEEICDMEEVPLQTEEIPHQLEEISHQLEDIPHQLEEIPHQIEDIQCELEDSLYQAQDISNHIEVIKSAKETGGIHERASKLLNMVNVNSPAAPKMFIRKRMGCISMSPSTARIKRLMSNFNQKQFPEDVNVGVKEEDILTFTREVPSPLAVPRSSILKRKLSDISETDGVSPCPKRKRVNFSDPCLTSQKLFIKDDYHQEHQGIFGKCLFDTSPEVKAKEEDLRQSFSSSDDLSASERLTETEAIETEPSLEMINTLLLKKDKPIYPKLVDCKEDVMTILKRVTSPMFITTLMNKLKNKDIKTIGDLAKQSEAEINRFPFKVPVVANVYKALDNYYKKNVDKNGKETIEKVEQVKVNGGEGGDAKRHINKRITPVKVVDVKTEFKGLLQKSKSEGTVEDLAKILLSSLEKQQLISLARVHYNIDSRDFLEEKDFKQVIRHITECVGLPGIFEILTESLENLDNESVYFDCMIKHSIEKKPLVNLLENRPLDDIKTGLEVGIKRNMFSKQELLDTCLLPLIENPSDISSYINQISMVQLGEVIVKRLQSTDLTQFFDQLVAAHGDNKNVVVSLSNEIFKNLSAPSDIVDNFKRCIDAQNEIQQNEVMVEMFKFISSKLQLNTLLELHVDFLKRIPSLVASDEK